MVRFGGQPERTSGRAVSSVVEHRLYTPAVTGSNPVPPTQECGNEEFGIWNSCSRIPSCEFEFPSSLGVVVQLVRTLPCHGRGRGFESRRPRHSPVSLARTNRSNGLL